MKKKYTETALPIDKGRGFTKAEVAELEKRGFTVLKESVKLPARSLAYKKDKDGANVEEIAREYTRETGIAFKVSDWNAPSDFTGFDQGLILLRAASAKEVLAAVEEALLKCPV